MKFVFSGRGTTNLGGIEEASLPAPQDTPTSILTAQMSVLTALIARVLVHRNAFLQLCTRNTVPQRPPIDMAFGRTMKEMLFYLIKVLRIDDKVPRDIYSPFCVNSST